MVTPLRGSGPDALGLTEPPPRREKQGGLAERQRLNAENARLPGKTTFGRAQLPRTGRYEQKQIQ